MEKAKVYFEEFAKSKFKEAIQFDYLKLRVL